jgi:hypothetical protein
VRTSSTFTSPSDGIIYFAWWIGNGGDYVEMRDIQLEKGSVVTDYVPHQESKLSLKEALKRLPNGVADTVELVGGKWIKTQRVGSHITTTVDFDDYNTNFDNVDLLRVADTLPGRKEWAAGVTGQLSLERFGAETVWVSSVGGAMDSADNFGKFAGRDNATIYIILPPGTYANIAEAELDLDGIEILYELALPIVTDITEEVDGVLTAFKDGTMLISSDTLINMDFESDYIPVTLGGAIQGSINAINHLGIAKAQVIYGDSTIPTTGHEASATDYAYHIDVAIPAIMSTDFIDVVVPVDSQAVAQTAGLCSAVDELDGVVRFYFNEVPTEAIPFKWKVVR